MSLDFETTIEQERLEKGQSLYQFLSELDEEEKNAIIGFRSIRDDLPDSFENRELNFVEFTTSLDVLARLGVCFVTEEEMMNLIEKIRQNTDGLYSDHQAWSVLTVLEVDNHEEFDESYYEANIYDEDRKMNPVPIDLIGDSDTISFVTCKSDITTQREAAEEKSEELQEISESIDAESVIYLGTLSVQHKERIKSQLGERFDKIISGIDILEFEE